MNHEKKLLNCLMIILELYLKLNTKQNTEKMAHINSLTKASEITDRACAMKSR